MMSLLRWLRNEPIEPVRQAKTFAIDTDARRYNRRQLPQHDVEHDYSITVNLGGFAGVGVPWAGTSLDDARDSFLEYLYNHDEFGLASREPHKFFRMMYVNFHGKHQLLVFRTSWITGFTIG